MGAPPPLSRPDAQHVAPDDAVQAAARDAEDAAIVHELQRLVRPCFRPATRPDQRRDPRGSVAWLPDAYDPHGLELAMRAGQVRPADFGDLDAMRLHRHAGSILAVALGFLLRGFDPSPAAAWLELFAQRFRPGTSGAAALVSRFTPAQRFVIAMSLHVAARRLGETAPGPHLRCAAEDWRPDAERAPKA